MKICFYLQRRFAFVGHAIAQSLQQKHPQTTFCGYVQVREGWEFLKSQRDIAYTSLLLDEDIIKQYPDEVLDWDYLKKLEIEYGLPNLWPYIEIDRIIRDGQHIREYPYHIPPYTHDDMLKILQVTAKNIMRFLDTEKPEAIIFSVVGSLSSRLLYEIARRKKIPVYIIVLNRVEILHTLTTDFKTLSYVDDAYQTVRLNQADYPQARQLAQKFLRSFRAKPAPYHVVEADKARGMRRLKHFRFLGPNILQSVGWFIKLAYRFCAQGIKHDYSTIKPWHFLIDKIKLKTRVAIGFADLYDAADWQKKFIYFPLQLEPEISTSLYAPFFTDQLSLLKQIAKSLPIDCLLYVKEHPAMFGKRPRQFYKEIKTIPNARLLDPAHKSAALIQNSQLVTTITSTVGLEAVMLKKPVITFGDVFYNILPNVKKCTVITDLAALIKERLENFSHDEKAVEDYITAMYKESVAVDLVQIWEVEKAGTLDKKSSELEPLVDFIAEKLNIK